MSLFDGLFLTLACPKCSYEMDEELLSVRLEATAFCPCCKVTIRLFDADQAVPNLQRRLCPLGKKEA